PPIDALAIEIKQAKDSCHLADFIDFAKEHSIAFQFGAVPPKVLHQLDTFYQNHKSIYIANWQDKHESNSMDLNGLIDFNGVIKPEFKMAQSFLKQQKYTPEDHQLTILRPAARLKVGFPYHYTAVFKTSNDPWSYYQPDLKNSRLEWFLLKCDVYGNPLVIKSIGNQSQISVNIPENYKNYQLVLKYYHNITLQTMIISLNTKILNDESDNSVLYLQPHEH